MALGGGYFKISYGADLALVDTRLRRVALAALVAGLLLLPRSASPFVVDLVTQTALAAVGALALNVLTGLAGQVSLGHAGFLAAGAFTTAALVEAFKSPPIVTLPAAGAVGALLGLIVGVPALRLKGLYLALGTLAMHHVVLYVGGELQSRWGANTGYSIPPPRLGGLTLRGTVAWYYALVGVAALVLLVCVNLKRSRVGRAWMAIRDREIAAASLGINVAGAKLLAFVWSSTLTTVAGALFAYHRGFVSVEAFSFFLAIEYIAMIIIGGLGSELGAVLGAAFVTLLPYGIDAGVAALRLPGGAEFYLFPLKFGAFGLLMALFLIFEPQGLAGIWRRVRNWFFLWPFRYRPLRPAP
ncbi:MAG: branched-chain amino acid ABC transporter permease [Candidatus Rokubacteria bacterium]|nr:branched-chain amino acid ABC transporter permease [Candidatus Rokubacteria bacterium]